jgi:hypothetical protein
MVDRGLVQEAIAKARKATTFKTRFGSNFENINHQ